MDIEAPLGSHVYSMREGRVIAVHRWTPGGGKREIQGNAVYVQHPDGIVTGYMHLSEILVGVGDPVASSALLGRSGDTGGGRGLNANAQPMAPHLHLSVEVPAGQGRVQVDPTPFVEGAEPGPDSHPMLDSVVDEALLQFAIDSDGDGVLDSSIDPHDLAEIPPALEDHPEHAVDTDGDGILDSSYPDLPEDVSSRTEGVAEGAADNASFDGDTSLDLDSALDSSSIDHDAGTESSPDHDSSGDGTGVDESEGAGEDVDDPDLAPESAPSDVSIDDSSDALDSLDTLDSIHDGADEAASSEDDADVDAVDGGP